MRRPFCGAPQDLHEVHVKYKIGHIFSCNSTGVLYNTNGVYFIHILIMLLLVWNMNFDGWARSLKLLFLEGVSVGGSVLLIAPLSRIPFCRRRMFGIKG